MNNSTTDTALTAALSAAAQIRDDGVQRDVMNSILDLQASWRREAQAFIARHSDLCSEAASHIEDTACALRVDPYQTIERQDNDSNS